MEKTNTVLSSARIPQDSVIHRYRWASFGFAGRFTSKQVEKMRHHPLVDRVVKDYYAKVIESNPSLTLPNLTSVLDDVSQSTPWGVSRVNGPLNGTGTTAWIIDSGIDLDHPDLNVDVMNSVSFVAQENANDVRGHGTHMAGIIAAKNNTQDVVGVAAGANVVALKVVNSGGRAYVSDIKAAVDYVANNFSSGDVVNISLGYSTYESDEYTDIAFSVMENSIINAANAGLKFSLSAGNSGGSATIRSPARVENTNVWTSSMYDINDDFVTGSSHGNPPIEYGAPGKDILSLYKDGGTHTFFRGTSMAAAHMTGLLLAAPNEIQIDGYVNGDPDNDPDPIAVYNLPLTVYISGPALLEKGEQGTWQAQVSNEDGPISYQWYYQNSTLDPWTAAGSNSDTFSHTFYQETDQAGIKVEITSAGEQDSSQRLISVSDPGCDPGDICEQ